MTAYDPEVVRGTLPSPSEPAKHLVDELCQLTNVYRCQMLSRTAFVAPSAPIFVARRRAL